MACRLTLHEVELVLTVSARTRRTTIQRLRVLGIASFQVGQAPLSSSTSRMEMEAPAERTAA